MLPLVLLIASLAFASCYEPRIIGGSETTIEKYPYQVSIHYNGVLKCGGSVISQNWVLTAAHCVYGTYSNKGGTLITGIKNTIYHELYDNESLEYDVALIQVRVCQTLFRTGIKEIKKDRKSSRDCSFVTRKLPSPIKESATAKSIALPPPGATVMTGSKALVTGWGLTKAGGSMSNTLKVLTAPVVDQDTCKKIYAVQHYLTKEMLCAGTMIGGQDTCLGDSGGPLVYNGVQIGIVSWGFECARPGYPGVYTRVSAVRSWITKHANV
ncbi:trypsin-1-like isoform X2 [Colletes gigas]|uniref:trypsin-1-like isoform X2 n=1 Tax=Colletes gigas TaxID=935657 RepID=UPI001C9AA21B|nr:trypsin-1-like isoform X2 [Colletes gigas]